MTTKNFISSPTLLLVDDDEEMCTALERVLVKDGYTVLAFSSAVQAWEHIETKRPFFQLIISDIRMPGMSGLTFLNNVKQLYPKIPIILITAYGEPRQKDEALSHGAFRYLYKPLPSQILLTTVRQSLGLPENPMDTNQQSTPKVPVQNSNPDRPKRPKSSDGFQEIKNMDEWLEKLSEGDTD